MGLIGGIVKAVVIVLTFVLITGWMVFGLRVDPVIASIIGGAAVFGEIVVILKFTGGG